jgi:hypothetical protein
MPRTGRGAYAALSGGAGGPSSSAMIWAQSTMHALQIATEGVDPATILSTSLPLLPQNEQRIDSSQTGPGGGSSACITRQPSPRRGTVTCHAR